MTGEVTGAQNVVTNTASAMSSNAATTVDRTVTHQITTLHQLSAKSFQISSPFSVFLSFGY